MIKKDQDNAIHINCIQTNFTGFEVIQGIYDTCVIF